MAKKEYFKKQAYIMLLRLNRNGFVQYEGKTIENVRQLANVLGISTGSLYGWKKRYENEGYTEEEFIEETYDMIEETDMDYPKSLFQNKEKQQDIQKETLKEKFRNFPEPESKVQIADFESEFGNLSQNEIDNLELIQKTQIKERQQDIQRSAVKDKKDVFGIRFYGWFAKSKGIKGYADMRLDELKSKIGKKLIQESQFPKL